MKVQISVKESVNLFAAVVVIVYLFRTAKQRRNGGLVQIQTFILWEQHKFSRAHWLIFIVNKRTDAWIYNLCDAVTSESGHFDSLLS